MAQYFLKAARVCMALATIFIIASSPLGSFNVSAASSTDFARANAAIASAYVSLYSAQIHDHTNVTDLADQLNAASQLVNTALVENSTNPNQASTDLLSAESIAQQVTNQAVAASNLGMSAYQSQVYESLGSVIVILIGAILVYKFSGLVYRQWWIRIHQNYSVRVRKRNEE